MIRAAWQKFRDTNLAAGSLNQSGYLNAIICAPQSGIAKIYGLESLLGSEAYEALVVDRLQRLEEPNLGLARSGGDMPYARLLEHHLQIRLAKYIRGAVGPFVSGVDMRARRATLLEKDFRTRTRSEQKAEVEEEEELQQERAAHQERANEERKRREAFAFEYRRSQVRASYGYASPGLMDSKRQQIEDRSVLCIHT